MSWLKIFVTVWLKRYCYSMYISVLFTSWQPRPWSKCSLTCGSGIQRRDYVCTRTDGAELRSTECATSRQPRSEERTCNAGSCNGGWYYTEWPETVISSVCLCLVYELNKCFKFAKIWRNLWPNTTLSGSSSNGDTLTFSYISRLWPLFGVQIFEVQYFWGFSEQWIFFEF